MSLFYCNQKYFQSISFSKALNSSFCSCFKLQTNMHILNKYHDSIFDLCVHFMAPFFLIAGLRHQVKT